MTTTLHIILVVGFVIVTGLFGTVTLINYKRLTRNTLSWRAGYLKRASLVPVVFLIVLGTLYVCANIYHSGPHPLIFGGYFIGGLIWLKATHCLTTTFVTENGIIRNVNRVDEAIAWGQISDYFSVPRKNGRVYVFIYKRQRGMRSRFELSVPLSVEAKFKMIVRTCLDARLEHQIKKSQGKQTLKS